MPNASLLGTIEQIVPVITLSQFNRGSSSSNSALTVSPSVTLGQSNAVSITKPFSIFITPSITTALVNQSIVAGGYFTKYSFGLESQLQGPPQGVQVPVGALGLATIITPSGQTVSPIIPSYYFPHITFGCTSTQAGAVTIQRYIDLAGTVLQGAALTGTLVANTALIVDNADGKGFGSFQITITNTGTVNATLSAVILLLLAR